METEKDATKVTKKHSQQPVLPHDSNPFTTAISSFKKLFTHNTGPLVAVSLFSFVVYVLMFVIGAAMLAGLLAFIAIHMPGLFATYDSASFGQLEQFVDNMNETVIYITWAVGTVLLLGLGTLLQVLQLKLATASSAGAHIEFSDLLRQGTKRIPALLGVAGLALAVLFAIIAVIVIGIYVAQPLGLLLFLLTPALIVIGIYIGLRLCFASFGVIVENLSPIAAYRRSWRVTRRHVAEVFGVLAASTIMVVVPLTLVEGLAQNLTGPVGDILRFIISLAAIAAAAVALVPLAERFRQLSAICDGKATATKTDTLNYLSVIFLFIATMIVGALSPPPPTPSEGNFDLDTYMNDINRDVDNEYKLN